MRPCNSLTQGGCALACVLSARDSGAAQLCESAPPGRELALLSRACHVASRKGSSQLVLSR